MLFISSRQDLRVNNDDEDEISMSKNINYKKMAEIMNEKILYI